MGTRARKTLKIAQVTPYYWPHIGGVESVVQCLSEGLVQRGHEVHVLTANRDQKGRFDAQCPHEEQVNGVNVYRFRAYLTCGHLSFFPGLTVPLMGSKFDVIHSHCYRHPHGEIAAFFGRRRGIPTILHGHGGSFPSGLAKRVLYGLYDHFAKRGLLNQFDHFIALTDFAKERFVALGADPRKISVIPNAVNDECFEEVNPIRFRERYRLNNKRVILYMGSLHWYKRPDLLIQALPRIVNKVPDGFVLLVGPDAGEYAKVKDIGERLGVSNHFKWIGPLQGKEKQEAYSVADFLVLPLPSDHESFSLVLFEGMAHGKPVIGSDAVGMSKIIQDGQTGFVVRRGNVQGFADAAVKLLRDPGSCEKMGRKAREVTIANYSASRAVDQVEDLYYQLAAVKGNPKAQQLKS